MKILYVFVLIYVFSLWCILLFESTRNETQTVLNEIVHSSSRVYVQQDGDIDTGAQKSNNDQIQVLPGNVDYTHNID